MKNVNQVISTQFVNPVTSRSTQARPNSEAATTYSATAANVADSLKISQAAYSRVAGEAKVGDTYDFRNITPNNMLIAVNGLIKSGQMTVDESSSLVRFLIPDSTVPTNTSNSINSDSLDPPVNFYAKLGQMIAFNKYIHNESAVVYGQKALAVLDRFQGTKILE